MYRIQWFVVGRLDKLAHVEVRGLIRNEPKSHSFSPLKTFFLAISHICFYRLKRNRNFINFTGIRCLLNRKTFVIKTNILTFRQFSAVFPLFENETEKLPVQQKHKVICYCHVCYYGRHVCNKSYCYIRNPPLFRLWESDNAAATVPW